MFKCSIFKKEIVKVPAEIEFSLFIICFWEYKISLKNCVFIFKTNFMHLCKIIWNILFTENKYWAYYVITCILTLRTLTDFISEAQGVVDFFD